MHRLETTPDAGESPLAGAANVEGEGESLNPILRLRQIAEELRAAVRSNDLEVACAAASLLGPTMDRCCVLLDADSETAGAAADLAREIRNVLSECESLLSSAASGLAAEMKRVRQGKRAISKVRERTLARAAVHNVDSVE